MLMTEWNWDDALAVRYEEGLEQGEEKKALEITRNALIKGFSSDVIHEITDLDLDEIEKIRAGFPP